MTFKKFVSACLALCLMATLGVAISGCDDLGAYKDTDEYYSSFGDIVLIGGTSKKTYEYDVDDYFYNKDSRENFLEDEDGSYKGVEYDDYVYMAIPFKNDINMDTLALYLKAQNDATVYINVFITDKIPSNWKAINDNVINSEESVETEKTSDEESSVEITETSETTAETVETSETTAETVETSGSAETENENKDYDDPNSESRIAEITVHLKNGKWSSFMLDIFQVNGTAQKSIEIKSGQYILLQIRNNSGVRIFDEEQQLFVDPQTGLELQRVEFTVTNLLIRALDIKNVNETNGGN